MLGITANKMFQPLSKIFWPWLKPYNRGWNLFNHSWNDAVETVLTAVETFTTYCFGFRTIVRCWSIFFVFEKYLKSRDSVLIIFVRRKRWKYLGPFLSRGRKCSQQRHRGCGLWQLQQIYKRHWDVTGIRGGKIIQWDQYVIKCTTSFTFCSMALKIRLMPFSWSCNLLLLR